MLVEEGDEKQRRKVERLEVKKDKGFESEICQAINLILIYSSRKVGSITCITLNELQDTKELCEV